MVECGVCGSGKSVLCANCATESVRRLRSLALRASQAAAALRVQIEGRVQRLHVDLTRKRDLIKEHRDILHSQITLIRVAISKDSLTVSNLAHKLKQRAESLAQARETLQKQRDAANLHHPPLLDSLRFHLVGQGEYLVGVRRQLAMNLRMLAELERPARGPCSIWGLSLPPLPWDSYDELIAGVLGHVVFLLLMLFDILNLSIPFQFFFRGSRSSISEQGSGTFHPLFPTGVAVGRFQEGLRILVRCLAHVCLIQGLPLKPSQMQPALVVDMLLAVFESPCIGWEGLPLAARPSNKPRGTSVAKSASDASTLALASSQSLDEEDGWDFVDKPSPPTPLQQEDLDHWTRAMYTDVQRR
eukprot:gnl/Hemi2/11308_TR3913_c0_g1_i1.p1 gnl/Hemi2/11308_TR3913_c0_g1~~gnl/Hemi2/11308_TR3913_c0_g1_i1.p1  ORF type:complete len:358 (+),score=44.70 gnl/Hemi2/11308_TR3913_c0_g1_i1:156-1229(+)